MTIAQLEGFNTASGKYCCNFATKADASAIPSIVSIPQAVSTVATFTLTFMTRYIFMFQYRKR